MAQLQKKMVLECEYLVTGNEDLESKIREIEEYFISLNAPKSFNAENPKNAVTLWKKDFQNLCTSLELRQVLNPGKLTVFELYSKIEFLDKKAQKNE